MKNNAEGIFLSDKYFGELENIAIQYVYNNYNYCYLKAMHEKNRKIGTSTIVVGSSHAMNGIVERQFMNGDIVNFSISSQDLYCDLLHIRKALLEGNKKIHNCFINIGYYMLFQDLSLSRQMSYMMPSVYGPLFDDVHHYQGKNIIDMFTGVEYDCNLYSYELIQKLCDEWATGAFIEQGSYYGKMFKREQNNILSINGVIWSQKNDEEKDQYAFKRAADHNRLRKYKETRLENDTIVRNIVQFLEEEKVKIIFLIFPFTQWYRRYIDPFYKSDIYELLDSLPQAVELLDLNEFDAFTDEDFLDTDHLNLKGAGKATKIIENFLETINNAK